MLIRRKTSFTAAPRNQKTGREVSASYIHTVGRERFATRWNGEISFSFQISEALTDIVLHYESTVKVILYSILLPPAISKFVHPLTVVISKKMLKLML